MIAARKVNLRGTSQGAMVSITSTWLTMQLDCHLQCGGEEHMHGAVQHRNGSATAQVNRIGA